ncbi:TIR domain-containing protein [Frankia tisae]|uniref:TIR domain-containing protein n=1 Tax=Frankia tisae TaxID=2950104 RepID=UPI0021C1C26A|nr:TIR domain-containing protein [Frankia tisae]
MILGGAGSGKTAAMMLLMEEILRTRLNGHLGPEEPIPVWLTLGGWNPDTTDPLSWVKSSLARDHPFLRAAKFGPNVIDRLISQRRIALFLDGLDEMPPSLRGKALSSLDLHLNDLRLVLTSRFDEYHDALARGSLKKAAVIELMPLDTETIQAHLTNDLPEQLVAGGRKVREYLREHPTGNLTEALNNPFMLSLAKSMCRDSDPAYLLSASLTSVSSIRHRILEKTLEITYPDSAERDHVTRRLTWLARKMGTNRDLAWWTIPTWLTAEQHWAGAALTSAAGILVAISPLLSQTPIILVLVPILAPITVFVAIQISLLMTLFGSNMIGDSMDRFRNGPIFGSGAGPRALAVRKPSAVELLRGLGNGALCGLACAAIGHRAGDLSGSQTLAKWLSVGLGLAGLLAFDLLEVWLTPVANEPSATPKSTYLLDRRTALVCGGAGGLMFGALVGLTISNYFGPALGITVGLYATALFGLLFGNGNSVAVLFFEIFNLCTQGHRVGIIQSLERAHASGILRTAGALYQFRHAELQEYLAGLGRPENRAELNPAGRSGEPTVRAGSRSPETTIQEPTTGGAQVGVTQYQVALSFAEEQAGYVHDVAQELASLGIKYFYYKELESDLWGKDLGDELPNIFAHGSSRVVIFTSKEYFSKVYTLIELIAAFGQHKKNRSANFILPVLLDDTPLQLLPPSTVTIDGRIKSPQRVAELIAEKIAHSSTT